MSHLDISKVVNGERNILPGNELGDAIYSFVMGYFLESKNYDLVVDTDDPTKYIVSLVSRHLPEDQQVALAKRYVEIPLYRRDGDSSYWVGFFLKKEPTESGDNLDQTAMAYNSVMSWDKPGQSHWDWDQAAAHIWEYLTNQTIDGSRFPEEEKPKASFRDAVFSPGARQLVAHVAGSVAMMAGNNLIASAFYKTSTARAFEDGIPFINFQAILEEDLPLDGVLTLADREALDEQIAASKRRYVQVALKANDEGLLFIRFSEGHPNGEMFYTVECTFPVDSYTAGNLKELIAAGSMASMYLFTGKVFKH